MFQYYVITQDIKWARYCDEVISSFDIREFIKPWDKILKWAFDSFNQTREVLYIETPKKV